MLFHLTFEVLEEIVLPEAKTMRNEWLGPQLQKVMDSGKVREAGLLVGKRGGFFLVDVDNPEELFTLFGPELLRHFSGRGAPSDVYGGCRANVRAVGTRG